MNRPHPDEVDVLSRAESLCSSCSGVDIYYFYEVPMVEWCHRCGSLQMMRLDKKEGWVKALCEPTREILNERS